jgi:hypothetical protein
MSGAVRTFDADDEPALAHPPGTILRVLKQWRDPAGPWKFQVRYQYHHSYTHQHVFCMVDVGMSAAAVLRRRLICFVRCVRD